MYDFGSLNCYFAVEKQSATELSLGWVDQRVGSGWWVGSTVRKAQYFHGINSEFTKHWYRYMTHGIA